LSDRGFAKAEQIMRLEDLLRLLEGEGRNWARDPNLYYVTVFGTPGNSGRWGLSFEGHHLSLNFSFRDGQLVDATPQFMASNPATVMNQPANNEDASVPPIGTQVLKVEEKLAFKLVGSLNEEQSAAAIIAKKAPKEIRYAGKPQAIEPDGLSFTEPVGITWDALDSPQQEMLRELVHEYFNAARDDVAVARRKAFASEQPDVHFAWAGATKPGIGHYYRIQGKTFLIEFVNTQPDAMGNPANHVHCVLRDLTGDFDLPLSE
ncbi:MAG: DUF3500 domain-containing protein, partial [Planctomycetota bacterium]